MAEASAWRTYLVEHYWPDVTEAGFRRAARRVATTTERMASAGEPVRFLHATLVPEDGAAYDVFLAASSDLVARAFAEAGVGYERLVVAVDAGVHPGHWEPP
jgi:hypothetical protein